MSLREYESQVIAIIAKFQFLENGWNPTAHRVTQSQRKPYGPGTHNCSLIEHAMSMLIYKLSIDGRVTRGDGQCHRCTPGVINANNR